MSWVCKYCSTSNEDSDKKCIVCDKDRSYGRDRILTRSAVEKLNLRGDVVIPAEYTAIGAEAFANRADITSVTLHENVTKIQREAFSGCISLINVICEGELISIGEKAFYNCKSLTKSNRPAANKVADNAFATETPAKAKPASKPDVKTSAKAAAKPKATYSPASSSYTDDDDKKDGSVSKTLVRVALIASAILFIIMLIVMSMDG